LQVCETFAAARLEGLEGEVLELIQMADGKQALANGFRHLCPAADTYL